MSDTIESVLNLQEAGKQIESAAQELRLLCQARWAGGKAWENVWKWRIPADEEHDTDLRIGKAIQIAFRAVKELRELRALLPAREGLTEGQTDAIKRAEAILRKIGGRNTADTLVQKFPTAFEKKDG